MIVGSDVSVPAEFLLVVFSLTFGACLSFAVWLFKTTSSLLRTVDRVEQASTLAAAKTAEAGVKLDHIHDCFETRMEQTRRHLNEQDIRLAVLEHAVGIAPGGATEAT